MLFLYCVCCAFASAHCRLVSPPEKGLASWLSFVVLNCVVFTSHLVSWVRFGTSLYRFLIFANLSYFHTVRIVLHILSVLAQ